MEAGGVCRGECLEIGDELGQAQHLFVERREGGWVSGEDSVDETFSRCSQDRERGPDLMRNVRDELMTRAGLSLDTGRQAGEGGATGAGPPRRAGGAEEGGE